MRQRLSRLFTVPVRILLKPIKLVWRGLGVMGIWLRRGLTRLIVPIWALLGRMGLALRKILTHLLRPMTSVLGRLVRAVGSLLAWFFRPIWALLGRMGIGLRKLLTRLIWRPLLFVTAPLRYVYRRWLRRLLRGLGRRLFWVWTQGARFAGWLVVRPVRALLVRIIERWHAGRPGRLRRLREMYARITVWRARLRVLILHPRPPRRAIVAPRVQRSDRRPNMRRATRWATSLVALALVAAASVMTAQQAPQLNRVVAQSDYQIVSSKFADDAPEVTPTPAMTATPAPSPTPWATPDPLNSGGSVAFTLRQNDNSDIYALSIGQSQPVRLTNDLAEDRDPAWSPDGERLAFSSRRNGNWDIYILTLATGDLQRLTDDPVFDGGASWSPDGQWLVYESYRHDNLDLYLISADGEQGPLRLTQHPAPDFAPSWSPTGRHVAFTSLRSGNKDLFLLSLDEAADDAARNVTNSPDLQEDDPIFSPDGGALAYSENGTGFELIYVLPLNNAIPSGEPVGRGQGRHPAWSPDGKALSYIHGWNLQSHLIASSLDAWSVAPQAFTANGILDDANWSIRTLPETLPDRLKTMNEAAEDPFFVETVFAPQEEGAPYFLQEVSVNAPAPYLNDRVDQSFVALRRAVQEQAGWDFLGELENLYEPMSAQPLPGQTTFTWNKAGRAFDYVADHALAAEPRIEIVREDRGYQIYWRTYLRAARQDGTQGEPLRDLLWDFRARFGAEPRYYDQGGKWKDSIPSGYYIDFTTLAVDYGWRPVAAGDNWRTYFPATNYWHYEKRQDLNWEQAMLEIYTPEQILAAFNR